MDEINWGRWENIDLVGYERQFEKRYGRVCIIVRERIWKKGEESRQSLQKVIKKEGRRKIKERKIWIIRKIESLGLRT